MRRRPIRPLRRRIPCMPKRRQIPHKLREAHRLFDSGNYKEATELYLILAEKA
jgi:hypothetical protein